MKCKICKDKFEPKYFNQKTCFNSSCVYEYSKQKKEQDWKKTKKKWKEDLKTVQDIVKDTQAIVNKYIRLRDEGKPCVSCGRDLGSKFDAGHYFSAGGHWAIRFDEDNIHGQCVHCNQWLHGNLINYRSGLIERIGEAKFYALEAISNNTRKYTKEELIDIQNEFKQKIKLINKGNY